MNGSTTHRGPTLGQLLSLTGSIASLIALAFVFIDKLAQSRQADPQLIIWRIVLATAALLVIAAVLIMSYFKILGIINSNLNVYQKVLRCLISTILALALLALFADGLYAALYWRWWLGSLVRSARANFSSTTSGEQTKKGPAGAISRETISRLSTNDRTILIGTEVVASLAADNSDDVEGFYVQSWTLKGACPPYHRTTIGVEQYVGYTVELRSANFDPYLIVSEKSAFSEDDDSGGGHNAQIQMTSIIGSAGPDDTRIAVTGALPGATGTFTLRARCGSYL